MNDLEQTNMLQPLVDEIETAVSNAKKEIAEKVNSVITETYWKIGKYIVEFEQPSCSLLFLVRDAPFSTLSIPYRAGPARGKTRKNPLPVPAKSTGWFCTLLRRCVQNLRQMLASSIANVLYWSEIKRQGGFHDGIYSETDLQRQAPRPQGQRAVLRPHDRPLCALSPDPDHDPRRGPAGGR